MAPEGASLPNQNKGALQGRKCLFSLVPADGIEPPTFGLQNRCSTAELSRLKPCCLTAMGYTINGRIARSGVHVLWLVATTHVLSDHAARTAATMPEIIDWPSPRT